MKRFFIPVFSFLLFALVVNAVGPDDQYIQIYNLIQEGDRLGGSGQSGAAREKYLQAQTTLKKLQSAYPNWNDAVIQFRLNYLTEKLGSSTGERPASPPLEKAVPEKKPATTKQPQATPGEDSQRVSALNEEVARLQRENGVLQAKLKEALSAQPAAIDPRELNKAEARIRGLEKDKELLRVSLKQEQAKAATPAATEELRKALSEANNKLARAVDANVALAREKEILEARLQSITREAATAKIASENKKVLEGTQPPPVAPGAAQPTPEANAALARLQTQLNTLQNEKAALEATKKDLETKLASASASAPKPAGTESERVKRLESERDGLLKKLNETTKQLYDNKSRTQSVQRDQYENQLAILRARLEVFEARKVPFTTEELALFKKPEVTTTKVDLKAGKKSLRELPRGAGPLLAEADRAFATRQYAEAEKKYLQVLKLDDKNVFTLANLGAIQLQQDRIEDAEASLKRALSEDPNDTRAVSLWGYLKFRQEKFDEALDALSRAAQLDPQNPEIQNYLGITLSHKGQRGPAETALRKAIQIAPGFGDAHQNLALIYASQQPPFKELARWHYQKSLACGNPQNPTIEKMIESGQASVTPPASEAK